MSLAEEATQDAFEAAVTRWRDGGVPESPRAWLIQTARYFAIDRLRRQRVLTEKLEAGCGGRHHPPGRPGSILVGSDTDR